MDVSSLFLCHPQNHPHPGVNITHPSHGINKILPLLFSLDTAEDSAPKRRKLVDSTTQADDCELVRVTNELVRAKYNVD